MSKAWICQIPRLSRKITSGVKEVTNIIRKNGVDAEIIDINGQIYDNFFNSEHWDGIEEFGITPTFKIKMLPEYKKIENIICKMFDRVREKDVIMISVFTTESRSWAMLVMVLIKKLFKHKVRIGLGGAGCWYPGESGMQSEWGDGILARKLCDFICLGESSKILKQLIDSDFSIKGKLYDQGKIFPPLGFLPKDIFEVDSNVVEDATYTYKQYYTGHPPPDHSDLSFSDKHTPKIHFTHGCVKKCTFCDVPYMTPQWSMRPAEKVIEEIDYYYNLNGCTFFQFPDNTINGSDSEFLKYLQLLAKWQIKNKVSIAWRSQLAIKPIRQQPNELFDLLKETNANLAVGFDHCSDEVLTHMKKLYTWKDIEHFLLQTGKKNIVLSVGLWIIGYPTETEKDCLEYQKLFDLLKHEKTSVRSQSVTICSINRHSPLLDIVDIDFTKPDEWVSKTGIDRKTRIARKKWVDQKMFEAGQGYFKYQTNLKRMNR